jgi:hypothetical protein
MKLGTYLWGLWVQPIIRWFISAAQTCGRFGTYCNRGSMFLFALMFCSTKMPMKTWTDILARLLLGRIPLLAAEEK